MRSNIEIKFLTPGEMAKARDIDYRYEHVDGRNLGFADPKKNRVFVRAGLDRELTRYLLTHELDHLFELEGSDEDEYGIRHKKFFKELVVPIARIALPIAAAFIPGLGPLASAALIAGTSFGTNTIADTITTGKPNWTQNLMNAGISGAGSFAGSAVGNYAKGFAPVSGKATSGSGFSGWVTGPRDVGSAWGNLGQAIATAPGGISLLSGGAKAGVESGLQTGLGMISRPTGVQGMFQPTLPSGFSDELPSVIPTFGKSMNMFGESAPSGQGVGPSGGIGLQTNQGIGQAGITLGGQSGMQGTSSGRGMNDIFGKQQMNPMMMPGFRPMGF